MTDSERMNDANWTKGVALAGDYKCVLTIGEINAWQQYAISNRAYQQFRAAEITVRGLQLMLVGGGERDTQHETRDKLSAAMRKVDDCENELFLVAKAWHEELKDLRAAEEAKRKSANEREDDEQENDNSD